MSSVGVRLEMESRCRGGFALELELELEIHRACKGRNTARRGGILAAN